MEQENVRALGIMGETVFTQNFHRAKEMKASIETGSFSNASSHTFSRAGNQEVTR